MFFLTKKYKIVIFRNHDIQKSKKDSTANLKKSFKRSIYACDTSMPFLLSGAFSTLYFGNQ